MTTHSAPTLLHHGLADSARRYPDAIALTWHQQKKSYRQLWQDVELLAAWLMQIGLSRSDRVAIYLPKQFETVISFFAASYAGLIFVPVNPVLKHEQVAHILNDSGAKLLITGKMRLRSLTPSLSQCPQLQQVLLSDEAGDLSDVGALRVSSWKDIHATSQPRHATIDSDPAAIFYTSGSTGLPKGVLLSHRNLVCGAISVSSYLSNRAEDKLLALLPFSFDYGFSQLSTAMLVGAELVLMDYLFPKDVLKLLEEEAITGLAAVPPLWVKISRLEFPETVRKRLRYITSSGGSMPLSCLDLLKQQLPQTEIFLMYGLTEAFRSTFLDPVLVDQYPSSMGKAIPNAEVLVLRENGSECDVDEPGELVHRGSLVAMGYWNEPELTAIRFKQLPPRISGSPLPEIAVYSGDTVKKDANGLFYFIGRHDEMMKTSGYRVSPSEIELVLHREFTRHEFAAFPIPDEELGQAIVLAIAGDGDIREQVSSRMNELLPTYMQARYMVLVDKMPLNNNNKIDRKSLARQYQHLQTEPPT